MVASLEADNLFSKVISGDARNLDPVSGPGPCTLRGLIHPNAKYRSEFLLRCDCSSIKCRLNPGPQLWIAARIQGHVTVSTLVRT